MIRGIFLVAVLGALLPATLSHAEDDAKESDASQPADADALLRSAEKAYEDLEYEQALRLLVQVIQIKDADEVQKARAFLYMGVCFTALGSADNAVAAFVEVLKLRPNFRIPEGVSPSIHAMFNEALKRMNLPTAPTANGEAQGTPPEHGSAPQAPPHKEELVVLSAQAPAKAHAGQPIEVDILFDDPDEKVDHIIVYYRRKAEGDYSKMVLTPKDKASRVQAMVPALEVGVDQGKLTYYVVAEDKDNNALGQSGTETEPQEVILLEPAKPKSKWKWYALAIGGGAALIAGGVVAAILLSKGSSGPAPGTVDVTVTLQ